jgi:hypothetical protein
VIVRITEEAKLIPAVFKLRNMLSDIVILHHGGIHEHAEVCDEDEVALRLVHRLETEPHAMSIRASIGINFLCTRDVAHDE